MKVGMSLFVSKNNDKNKFFPDICKRHWNKKNRKQDHMSSEKLKQKC